MRLIRDHSGGPRPPARWHHADVDLYGETTAEQYGDFAKTWAADSPTFVTWARGVAEDPEVLALVESLPEVKRQPNLLFAAARWHGAEPEGYEALRRVLLADWPAVEATVLRRSTQTNEVGRCATLLPVLATLPGPLALLEVGCSAGLCLFPDRYSYRWSDGTSLDPVDGPAEVVLRCEVSGRPPLPGVMPEVVWRAGLDLNPLDVRDDDAMAWLQALVWPGHDERRDRLAAAIGTVRAEPPADLRRGDLLTDLSGLVAEAPRDATLVVLHSAVVFYLTPQERDRFDVGMRRLVDGGTLHWVSNEGPEVLPRVTGTAAVPDGRFALGLDGAAVGWTHGHGHELGWLGPAAREGA